MQSKTDVVIVGGGVIGLACAHYLSQNEVSVRIIEKGIVGSGASHGNCGLLHFSGVMPLCSPGVVRHEIKRALLGISPLYIKPTTDLTLIRWLFQFARHCRPDHRDTASTAKKEILGHSLELFDRLLSENEFRCDFKKKGLLLLFSDPKYHEKYRETNQYLTRFDAGATHLDKTAVREFEPAVSKNIVGGWFHPQDWHLRPEDLIESWKSILVDKGVLIDEDCEITGVDIRKGKIRQMLSSDKQFQAEHFVLTTGAWAPKIADKLKLSLPVQPGKGYSLTMKKPENSPETPCLFYERNMVATPWQDSFRLGGTMEFSGFNHVLNPKRLAKLIKGAQEYLNIRVHDPVLEEWAGLRPMTPDDLPIIDRSASFDNLLVATGHGMLGVTLATGTGKAISDLIRTGKADIDLAPFSMSRF